jgi:hypothetical protein
VELRNLASQHSTLNDDGTRASVEETQLKADGSTVTRTTTWTYDAMNRLTGESVTSSDSSEEYTDTYTYDVASNRMSKTHNEAGTAKISSSGH